jgi:hypothetical protein
VTSNSQVKINEFRKIFPGDRLFSSIWSLFSQSQLVVGRRRRQTLVLILVNARGAMRMAIFRLS